MNDLTTTLCAYAVTSRGYGDTEIVIMEQTRDQGIVIGESDPIVSIPLDVTDHDYDDGRVGIIIDGDDTVDPLDQLDAKLERHGYRRTSRWEESATGCDALVEAI